MFSPGWGCDGWFYLYLGARLASHGFVVAVVTNFDEYVETPAMPSLIERLISPL